MAAQVRLLQRMDVLWKNLRAAMDAKALKPRGCSWWPGRLDVKDACSIFVLTVLRQNCRRSREHFARRTDCNAGVGKLGRGLVSDGLWSPEDVAGQQTAIALYCAAVSGPVPTWTLGKGWDRAELGLRGDVVD